VRRRSLRTRLFLAIGLIVVLSVGLTLGIGVVLTRRAVEHATLQDVAHQADLLAGRERLALLPFAHLEGLRPFLARQDERVVAAPLDRPSDYLSASDVRRLRSGSRVEGTVRLQGSDWFFAARPVAGRAFVLLRPKRLGWTAWSPFVEGLLIAGVAGAALAAAAAFLLARVIARPVRRVAAASRSLARGARPEPVPPEGADELIVLASSFNDLAEQLERAKAAERSFLLSVSHELKTPLTAIRGYAEAIADGAVASEDAAGTIHREADRLERLVGDLLDLARLNRSEFSIRSGEVDLAEVAEEAERRYEATARSFGVELAVEAARPAPAVGDADRVLQVASNLVENALRLAPPGASVRIVAEPGRLTVEDTGPGLRPEELPHAFDRFYLWSRYRGERRVGTGLGLAIVKQLTEAMGGTVEARSDPGEPTRFTVRLPAAAPAHPAPSEQRVLSET
jgi:two-component system sensor histidine kinase BaeS